MKLISFNKQDLVYDNLEDIARLDFKANVGSEKNSDKSEGQNLLKSQNKIVLAKFAGCCQVRTNLYSQINIFSVNKCKYFKYNTCSQ